MFVLILVVIGLIAISFICSVLESVILSITRPHIQVLIENGNRAGKMLKRMKEEIEEPISAILTLNTISHTVGAAVSGAIALQLFGSEWMALFSGVLTLLILILSEIIPKTIGAHYWKQLGPASAFTLRVMIFILKPLIIPVNLLSKLFSRHDDGSNITRAEMKNYIRLGYSEGALESGEFRIVDNLFRLKSIPVSEIMTPRSVVFSLDTGFKIDDIKKKKIRIDFSRIPIYDKSTDLVKGIIHRRDIMDMMSKKKFGIKLNELSVKAITVPHTASVYYLLNILISKRVHIMIVLDEAGTFSGIVTLEDALETLLGQEIVDEFDPVVDMRTLTKGL